MEKRVDYTFEGTEVNVTIVYQHYNRETGDRFNPPSYGYAEVEQILLGDVDIMDILHYDFINEVENHLKGLILEER